MIILFFFVFRMGFFEKTSVGRLFCEERADALQDANENEKNDHADVYDILMELVLSVADREAAKTACTDGACHCGKTDKADGGDGGNTNKLRNRFMQIDSEDQTEGAASHASCRFNFAGSNVGKCGLHLSCKERNRTENERNDGPRYADCRTDKGSGEGDEKYQKDDKRNGTKYVDENIDDREDHAIRLDAVIFGYGENDTDDKSKEKRDDTRDGKHLKGGDASIKEFILVIKQIRYEFFKKRCHVRLPPF